MTLTSVCWHGDDQRGDARGAGRRIRTLFPQLNENQRRALLGAEARELGFGGVSAVARMAGVARSTVTTAVAELKNPNPEVLSPGRARRATGCRPTRR